MKKKKMKKEINRKRKGRERNRDRPVKFFFLINEIRKGKIWTRN